MRKDQHPSTYEFHAYIKRGYFPSDISLAIRLGSRAKEFYSLLIMEWWKTGRRLIVHGRLKALCKQAGYKSVNSTLYELKQRGLLIPVGDLSNQKSGASCLVVARPYTDFKKSTQPIIPLLCTYEGISTCESVWCLPSNIAPVVLTRSESVAVYRRLLDIAEGSDGNKFGQEALKAIVEKVTKKTRTLETITDLLEEGMLRTVSGSDLYELIARPYKIVGETEGKVYVPSQCQPPANLIFSEPEEDLPAEFDEVVSSLEGTPEPTTESVPEPVPDSTPFDVLSVAEVETEVLLAEIEQRIRREHALLVERGMGEINEELAILHKRFITGNVSTSVDVLLSVFHQKVTDLMVLTNGMNDRLENIRKLRESLKTPLS